MVYPVVAHAFGIACLKGMTMDKIIEVTGLKKAYKDVQAVRGADFYAERGKLFALLGPNAAAMDCERETPWGRF